MDKFQNKYRIPSARAPFWDYGWNAAYFVTICTRGMECFFGNVVNGRMKLSAMGHIANSCWYEIPNHFPFLELGVHIVMPNHVHGIIIINKPDNDDGTVDGTVSPEPTKPKNQFGPQSQNLASIIRGFKIGVTQNARLVNPDFAWQSRYHDHIIRDQKSYQNISAYIINNPLKWNDDKFNPDKIDGNNES
ncbi:MAG: transposase [Marinilabilia sp.]